MLQYFKTILQKVSFSQELFEKELKKAVKALFPDEVEELKVWCYEKFGMVYRPILQKVF